MIAVVEVEVGIEVEGHVDGADVAAALVRAVAVVVEVEVG